MYIVYWEVAMAQELGNNFGIVEYPFISVKAIDLFVVIECVVW